MRLINEESPDSRIPGALATRKKSKMPTLELYQQALNSFGENDKVIDPAAQIEQHGNPKGFKTPKPQNPKTPAI